MNREQKTEETQFTKGEWKVRFGNTKNEDDGTCIFFIEARPDGRKVPHGIEIMMDDYDPEYPREQKLADAKLIASAPELLAACIKQKSLMDEAGLIDNDLIDAINKATK